MIKASSFYLFTGKLRDWVGIKWVLVDFVTTFNVGFFRKCWFFFGLLWRVWTDNRNHCFGFFLFEKCCAFVLVMKSMDALLLISFIIFAFFLIFLDYKSRTRRFLRISKLQFSNVNIDMYIKNSFQSIQFV